MTDVSQSTINKLSKALKHTGAAGEIVDFLNTIDVLSDIEVGFINDVTAGTAAASKALVLDASKGIATITSATISTLTAPTTNVTNLDAGKSGVAGTVDVYPATGAKGKLAITCASHTANYTVTLNAESMGQNTNIGIPNPGGADCDIVLNLSDQTIAGTKTFSADILTSSGVGAAAGTGNVATEKGDGAIHKTVFTFTDTPVVLADEAGVVAYGGLKVYDFPEGVIRVLGAVLDVDLTKSSAGVNDDWDGDVGVGTITASNDATLAATEQNIIPTTATPQAAAGATTANAQSTATEAVLTLDGTATAADLFVNLLVDDADHDVTGTACNLIMNGTLTVLWSNLGDY